MSFIKNSEVNRQSRTAAKIGLAISIGASTLLLPGQADETLAAQPVAADPTTAKAADASNDASIVSLSANEEPAAASAKSFASSHLEKTNKETATSNNLPSSYGQPSSKTQYRAIPSPFLNPVASQTAPATLPSVISPKPTTTTPATSPVAIPHSLALETASNPVPAKTQAESATPKVMPGEVYQVKSGDTLDEIAQAYGVSRAELIVVIPPKAGKVSSPTASQIPSVLTTAPNLVNAPENTPKVLSSVVKPQVVAREVQPTKFENTPVRAEQKLTSLVSPILTSVPRLNPTSNGSVTKLPEPIVPVNLAAPTLPISTITARGASKPGVTSILTQPTVARETLKNPTIPVPLQVNQSSDFKANLQNSYIDNLKNEIVQMRDRYRSQREDTVALPTAKPSVPAASNASQPANYINPEFNPSGYNRALQRENQNFQQPKSAPIQIKVPAPDAPSARKPLQVAIAPTGADTYNPIINPPAGQTVAPELPFPGGNPYQQQGKFTGYIWPAKGVMTSGFGPRWGRMHKGIDIAAPTGTPVLAAAPGVVVYSRWNSGGYGNLVDIQHSDGSLTRYGHNSRLLVKEGQKVQQGQQIAEMGSTGHSTGPHCHFEVHPSGGSAVNPMAFLPRRS